jgi:hypothetical protein
MLGSFNGWGYTASIIADLRGGCFLVSYDTIRYFDAKGSLLYEKGGMDKGEFLYPALIGDNGKSFVFIRTQSWTSNTELITLTPSKNGVIEEVTKLPEGKFAATKEHPMGGINRTSNKKGFFVLEGNQGLDTYKDADLVFYSFR